MEIKIRRIKIAISLAFLFLPPLSSQGGDLHPFDLGKAAIQADGPVVAGSFTTVTFTYTAGHPIDESDFIRVAFRSIGDFGVPQFDQPALPNYCTVYSSGDIRIEPRWERSGYPPSPFGQSLILQIKEGFLDKGENVVVVFGDTSGGSPGWQMQTFVEKTFEFKTSRVSIPVDPLAAYEVNELPDSPTLRIVPGKPARVAAIAPSRVLVNEEFPYHLRLEDEWGNPTELPTRLTHPGYSEAGVQTIMVTDKNTGLSARSNPIEVSAEPAVLNIYWADFHGQSEENDISNLQDYYAFARDYGLLDISAHQSNDKFLTYPYWQAIKHVAEEYYEPDKFLTFPGYEWSAYESVGGHRNVFYASANGEIYHSRTDFPVPPDEDSPYKMAPTVPELYANLKNMKEQKVFVFEHSHSTNPSIHEPSLELAVEIHSGWGTFEWIIQDALRLGYRVGVVANSDGHRGRPGAEYPSSVIDGGAMGGLTAVLAEKLDRDTVFEALKARHFYATTGIRALVDVKVVTDDGRSAMMGDVISDASGTPHLYVSVVGTNPIESVDVWNGLELVKTVRPFGNKDLGSRVKVIWGGIEDRGDGRQGRAVDWDGFLRLRNNLIKDVTPVNFWNPFKPLEKVSEKHVAWTSTTMGNESGIILTLDDPDSGSIEVETLQGSVTSEISAIGLQPLVWDYGGLQKRIEVYRLPEEPGSREFEFSLPLTDLRKGDNPIYIRMTQEDGQMAWSSPVYLVRRPPE